MNNHPLEIIDFSHRKSYIIEASAGSGKTWSIERLFVKALLQNPEIKVNQILVVTFTNDATYELRNRISEQIKTTINILTEIKQNPITTSSTHDLFSELDQNLSHHDLFSELDKNLSHHDLFSELDEDLSHHDLFTQHYLKTRRDYIFQDILHLVRVLQNFDQASIYTIHGFCNKVLTSYPLECNLPNHFELSSDKSNLIINLINNFLQTQIINNPIFTTSISTVIQNLNIMFPDVGSNNNLAKRINTSLPHDLIYHTQDKVTCKYQVADSPNLEDLSLELNQDNFAEIKYQFLSELILYIVAHYPHFKVDNQTISFNELINLVEIAVHGDLGLRLSKEYPIAFIDEFQDTDNLQWRIFKQIYLLDCTSPRGMIIAVGDPKQSIYRFRGADIYTYILAKNTINNTLNLLENYRSHHNIVNFVNQLFDAKHQMMNDLLGESIKYHPTSAKVNPDKLPKLPDAKHMREISQISGCDNLFYNEEVQLVIINGKNADERTQQTLLNLSYEILTLLNANPDLIGKIAILVSTNYEATRIVEYLRNFNILAVELKLGSIFKTTTASDLFAILNAINDLGNHQLFMHAISGSIFNFNLATFISQDSTNTKLVELKLHFATYREILHKQGLISLIYHLTQDIVAVNPHHHGLNKRQLSNLFQLGELLNHKYNSHPNLSELLVWFEAKINQENIGNDLNGTSEELVRLDDDGAQITITTQHKAKGLEYDILFCPFFRSEDKMPDLPLFANYYSEEGKFHAQLVNDAQIAHKIHQINIREVNRLNYVALTRAKQRIYIYLQSHTLTRNGYHHAQKPSALAHLFGYVKNNYRDNSHPLFNYPNFFSDPIQAFKQVLPGVVAYTRNNLSFEAVTKLSLNKSQKVINKDNSLIKFDTLIKPSYVNQSYSSITSNSNNLEHNSYYEADTEISESSPSYIYPFLELSQFRRANFGVLFHELCQNYPNSIDSITQALTNYNLPTQYAHDLSQMLEQTFAYKLIANSDLSLNNLSNYMAEFEFNLTIDSDINITDKIAPLISDYFGEDHPYTHSIKMLNQIDRGFLVGFIDLFFEYQGKYWVLDYKTNSLSNYHCGDIFNQPKLPLIKSMAEHYYYLQYLLYLVAVKRFIEKRLKVSDGSKLIGGAIYYYVKGACTTNINVGDGLYLDNKCQNLILELDQILKASVTKDQS